MIVLCCFVSSQAMFWRYKYFPGDQCGKTIQFLIEITSQPANDLPEGNPWCKNISQLPKVDFIRTTKKEHSEHAANQGTWKAQPTDPNGKQIQRMGQVMMGRQTQLNGGKGRSQHVPETCTE